MTLKVLLLVVLLWSTIYMGLSKPVIGEDGVCSYDPSTGRGGSLASSTWPSDHGDNSRTKYTCNAGFPKEIDPAKIYMVKQDKLAGTQWIYTGGEASEHVYAMGGPPNEIWVAKMDSKTLDIEQEASLDPALYIGGLLLHQNGHVYGAHGNKLYRFRDGDLDRKETIVLPQTLNGAMLQANCMVTTTGGLLVVKQWSMVFEDLGLHFFFVPVIKKLIVAMFILGAGIASRVMRPPSTTHIKDKAKRAAARRGWLTFLAQATYGGCGGLLVLVCLLLGGLRYILGPYDMAEFLFTNTPLGHKHNGGGVEVKILHPDTLEVMGSLFHSERASFGRMSLSKAPDHDEEDALVLIGDEHIRQFRWVPSEKRLYEKEDWAARYRTRGDGSFPGTGPAIFNGAVYFTDNTFPVFLSSSTYSMFKKDLTSSTATMLSTPMVPPGGNPGFMFWSIVVSPFTNGVMAWDSANDNVQMRDADTLELHWKLRAVQSDCATLAADRGHVYLADYSESPGTWQRWGAAVGKESATSFPDAKKFLIVADVATGNVLLNVTVQDGGGMKPSLIVPGGNDDVFMAGPKVLTRISMRTSP